MPRPPTRHTFEARLIAYAKAMKPSEGIKAQPAFCGSLSKNGTRQFSFPGELGSLRRQLPRYKFDCAN